jgi:phage shock protein A
VIETPRTDAAFRSAIREANDSAEPLNEMIGFSMKLERELNAANANVERLTKSNLQLREGCEELKQRIKRLEKAGDILCCGGVYMSWNDRVNNWTKAKEAKL